MTTEFPATSLKSTITLQIFLSLSKICSAPSEGYTDALLYLCFPQYPPDVSVQHHVLKVAFFPRSAIRIKKIRSKQVLSLPYNCYMRGQTFPALGF